jgi:DNA-binding response OmpR family regulator
MTRAERPEWDVLVIDDEEVVRGGITRLLSDEGLRVAGAADAASGLSHAALADCRLVLCDLMLPDRSGLDLLRELRLRRQDVPLVCITGYATRENQALAADAGATTFLPKPFDSDELLSVVRRALGAGGPRGRAAGEDEKAEKEEGQ